ncbi:MAG: hypothetical protein E6K79_01245 [Candidatus Eisenbacteria bacterium]|uniref:Uncharacterized protein n=1 Tax=Eiseniibacteriota bacterium TaxID=2212470 RepID=A0A538TTF7_UNCEI|nr:MAG: hypothetical protein E6K79_01245 [Candidatus Eisenbacteria bacterium]
MLRSILYALSVLLALRFVSVIARMITAGKGPGPQGNGGSQGNEGSQRNEGPQDRGEGPLRTGERPPRSRVQRSDAVDVPFTDIPPDSPPDSPP